MENPDATSISFSMENSNQKKDDLSEVVVIIEDKKSRSKCNENCDFYCCIVPSFICVSIICCCNSTVVISRNADDLQVCPDLFPHCCPNLFFCCYLCRKTE